MILYGPPVCPLPRISCLLNLLINATLASVRLTTAFQEEERVHLAIACNTADSPSFIAK